MAMKKAVAAPPATTELVEIMRNRAITTSLKVAEVFEKDHDKVVRDIRRLTEDMEGIAKIGDTPYFRETTYIHSQNGQEYPMFEMNRDGFTLLAMGFTGKRALQFKLAYINAFNTMEEILSNRRDPEWQAIREEVKLTFRALTDAIKEVIIPLARAKGSTTNDDRFYQSWSRMLCEIGCYQPRSRDKLSRGQLYLLHQLEDIAVAQIRGLAALKFLDYKAIYRQTKIKLNNFAKIAMINERFGAKLLESGKGQDS